MSEGIDPIYAARFRRKYGGAEGVRRYVAVLYDLLAETLGADKMVLRAGKLNALKLMRSNLLPERILALQRLVFEDPSLERMPPVGKYRAILSELEDALADLIAQKSVGDAVERKISAKMAQRHKEYLKDLKLEALREDTGPETPAAQRKLSELEQLSERSLTASALQLLRPAALEDIVGQETAIHALLTKISTPYPQHVILYGPPGVGKTTAARLVLEAAKKHDYTPFNESAPFLEANGTTLRWDSRETTNPLLGSVHDPIYQGSRRDLAEGGIPEPKLGLVTKAHGGVLFIDEIGEMDPALQTKLLKVLEDKRVFFESSYYDAQDANVPEYIRRLFAQGAPADFMLIGATTRDSSDIDPALRSRCAEVYFEPLTAAHIQAIVVGAAKRLGTKLGRRVPELIASYTIEGRKAVQILADAYGNALYRSQGNKHVTITEEDVTTVVRSGRLVEHSPVQARDVSEVGKTFGLGVVQYVGSIIEIEAVAFPAVEPRKGTMRFNETAGSMARDSVFNAASVVRGVTGIDPFEYDMHINIVGGGNIDGPSAGLAIFMALYSALTKTPLTQNIAMTGELSIQGKVRPIGGVAEKIYAARQTGMRAVIIPKENQREAGIPIGVELITVSTVEEVFAAFGVSGGRAKRKR